MSKLHQQLTEDIRIQEGLQACMNCGVCTAICPAAGYYRYHPRLILQAIQSKDEEQLLALLKDETIWYCGQCMSCKTRCPRGNSPGIIISALRELSQKLGYFTYSEKGRQQFAIKRTIGETILKYGYCVHPEIVDFEMHKEQGPVWKWIKENTADIVNRLGGNYMGSGGGTLKKNSEETLNELDAIFRETGGHALFEHIEKYSEKQAHVMKLEFKPYGIDNEYFEHVYHTNNNQHSDIL